MDCTYKWNCPAGSFPYTVRKGDTLYALSKKFATTVDRLAEINSITDPDRIYENQELCIPLPLEYFPSCRTTNYYVVQDTDTVESIAEYFKVDVRQLLYSNIGIDADNLYTGMILCIPLAPPVLCIKIEKGILTLNYCDGKRLSFPYEGVGEPMVTNIVQKQINTSTGGIKRLNFLVPDMAIVSPEARRSPKDIVLTEEDMDTVFNLVSVGTEVTIL